MTLEQWKKYVKECIPDATIFWDPLLKDWVAKLDKKEAGWWHNEGMWSIERQYWR